MQSLFESKSIPVGREPSFLNSEYLDLDDPFVQFHSFQMSSGEVHLNVPPPHGAQALFCLHVAGHSAKAGKTFMIWQNFILTQCNKTNTSMWQLQLLSLKSFFIILCWEITKTSLRISKRDLHLHLKFLMASTKDQQIDYNLLPGTASSVQYPSQLPLSLQYMSPTNPNLSPFAKNAEGVNPL